MRPYRMGVMTHPISRVAIILWLTLALVAPFMLGGCAGRPSAENADTINVALFIQSEAPDYPIDQEITVNVKAGASVYDALLTTDLDVKAENNFVTSIEGIANGDAGESSGWTYSVNGETPMVGANEYALQEGDEVTWTYIESWS